jgi:hypothetical protein
VPARVRDPSAVRSQSVRSAPIKAASTAFWLAMFADDIRARDRLRVDAPPTFDAPDRLAREMI